MHRKVNTMTYNNVKPQKPRIEMRRRGERGRGREGEREREERKRKIGREGERERGERGRGERGREGERERGEGEREGGRRGREGERERGREGERERGREGERERGREYLFQFQLSLSASPPGYLISSASPPHPVLAWNININFISPFLPLRYKPFSSKYVRALSMTEGILHSSPTWCCWSIKTARGTPKKGYCYDECVRTQRKEGRNEKGEMDYLIRQGESTDSTTKIRNDAITLLWWIRQNLKTGHSSSTHCHILTKS